VNNTLNVHHLQIEKEFKKLNKHKNSAHGSVDAIYLNVNSLHAKSSKSGSSATSMSKIDRLTINNVAGAVNGGGYETENDAAYSDSASAKNRKLVIDLGPKPTAKSKFIRIHIEVSVEKLQQNLQGHLLTLNIKNLHVEPLMEVNYIKAKLSYLKIELVNNDTDASTNQPANSGGDDSANNIKNSAAKFTTNARTFVKLNRFKEKKCKFDRNLKNFAKPMDFELSKDHFIYVSEEAVRAQMKKLNIKMGDEMGDDGASDRTVYLFLFWIELHSYLPVSRKTLSSTFRKQKRVFKGECQIFENFINMTQFPKTFIANEV
jgi:hypothetical protein